MRALCYAALAFALVSAPVWARKDTTPSPPPPMPAGYDDPGPKPENVLPAILADLRKSLNDPYSIRDFTICEPEATKPVFNSYDAGSWMRSKWKVNFSLNAKNRMGGYVGATAFIASYQDGKLESVSSIGSLPTVSAKMVREIAACKRVSDAEVQRLVQL